MQLITYLLASVDPWTYTNVCSFPFIYHLWLLWLTPGVSKGVGFIRFDQRNEAERAIQELNGKVPKGCTDPITVKFANNPSNNAKAMPPLAAYLTPQARRFAAGALPAGRFRLDPLRDFSINPYFCPDPPIPLPFCIRSLDLHHHYLLGTRVC